MMSWLQADPIRWVGAGVATAAWLATLTIPWRHRQQSRQTAAQPVHRAPLVIAYASQGGSATALARSLHQRLPSSLRPDDVLPLETLDLDGLHQVTRACFIISTTGAGDPPDHAVAFLRRAMDRRADLSGLSYSLLALGDRTYARYCGFGHDVDRWLQACGARPAHPLIEVDRLQSGRLADWQRAVDAFLALAPPSGIAGHAPDDIRHWRMMARQIINPGSPGAPIFQLRLQPDDHRPDWQAGDIAQIAVPDPETGGETWREYSLASLPADGEAELLLRQTMGPDGEWGLGAHWLCRALQPGGRVRMRVRPNPGFHPPAPTRPLLLIGHGTGLAGLVGQLRARQLAHQAGQATGPAWLLYGERSAQHDAHLDERLQAWLADGTLTRLDRAYSRSESPTRYVQDLIEHHADDIRHWVLAEGAAVYVCGRRDTMGAGVQAALEAVLGPDVLARHDHAGHYRRDMY